MAHDRLTWARENPAACLAPFSGLSLRAHYTNDPGVRYSCCCNLDVKDIPPSQQQDFFQNLRSTMQQGQLHTACGLCYQDEQRGAVSERIRYWLDYPDQEFDRFLQQWHSDVFEIKVKFSNLCPMACRSCDGAESSTYAQITQDHSVYEHIRQDFTLDNGNWHEVQQSVMQVANSYARPVLHLIGGEPLVQPGCERLMSWMQQQDLCSRFELRLTTSWAVNLSNEFLSLMKHFRHVTFLLSIDSTGANYQYVRWPVKWEKVERNLEKLIQIRPTLQSSSVHLVPVFSLNNAFYIKDYLDYFKDWQEQHQIPVVISNQHLYQPEHLQLEILPEPYRQELSESIVRCLQHPMVATQPVLRSSLQSTVDQLRASFTDQSIFSAYLKHTAEFDVRTRTNLQDYNDRLWNLLSHDHRRLYLYHLDQVNVNIPIPLSIQKTSHDIDHAIPLR